MSINGNFGGEPATMITAKEFDQLDAAPTINEATISPDKTKRIETSNPWQVLAVSKKFVGATFAIALSLAAMNEGVQDGFSSVMKNIQYRIGGVQSINADFIENGEVNVRSITNSVQAVSNYDVNGYESVTIGSRAVIVNTDALLPLSSRAYAGELGVFEHSAAEDMTIILGELNENVDINSALAYNLFALSLNLFQVFVMVGCTAAMAVTMDVMAKMYRESAGKRKNEEENENTDKETITINIKGTQVGTDKTYNSRNVISEVSQRDMMQDLYDENVTDKQFKEWHGFYRQEMLVALEKESRR